MAPDAAASGSRLQVRTAEEARALVASLATTVEDLGRLMEEESGLLSSGRLREGLATEARKGELATAYLRGLEAVKANLVAIRRLAPDLLAGLGQRQAAFRAVVDRNQAVVATARTVSDDLMKGLAEEVARTRRPAAYGATQQPTARRSEAATPLIFSGRF